MLLPQLGEALGQPGGGLSPRRELGPTTRPQLSGLLHPSPNASKVQLGPGPTPAQAALGQSLTAPVGGNNQRLQGVGSSSVSAAPLPHPLGTTARAHTRPHAGKRVCAQTQ